MSNSLLKGRSIQQIADEFKKFAGKEYFATGPGKHVELRTLTNADGAKEIYVLSGSCLTGIEIFEDRIEALAEYIDFAKDLKQMSEGPNG